MEEFTIAGVKYLGHDALTFGDYGGAGSVGVANVRDVENDHEDDIAWISYSVISDIQATNKRGKDTIADFIADFRYQASDFFADGFDKPKIYKATGSYGSTTIYVRADIWTKCEYGRLDDYPLLSDDTHSEIEMEWENEAFESWAESDLIRSLDDRQQEKLDTMPDETRTGLTWEAYRVAMEETNTYPTPEYSGSHIDIDRIAEEFQTQLIALLGRPPAEPVADLFKNE